MKTNKFPQDLIKFDPQSAMLLLKDGDPDGEVKAVIKFQPGKAPDDFETQIMDEIYAVSCPIARLSAYAASPDVISVSIPRSLAS